MKKMIAFLSAAAIVSAVSVTAFATDANEQSTNSRKSNVTISTSVAPAYMVSIPANTTVAFNQTRTAFGTVMLESARIAPNKAVKVTITSDGELNNSADRTTVIPYSLTAVKGNTAEEVRDGYFTTLKDIGEKIELTINISQRAWDSAAAGDYSDTVTFNIAYVEAG